MRLIVLLLLAASVTGCVEFAFDKARLTNEIYERQKWKQLAKEGDAEAQYKVGTLYCCGERPHYDNAEALKWFCKAAKQGQRDALFAIGYMYENANDYEGNVVPQDLVMATTYYTLAEKEGYPREKIETRNATTKDAIAHRKGAAVMLTREQKKESEMLVKRWPNILCEVVR